MQNITLLDYLLLPFYLVAIYVIAFRIRNKYYPDGHEWRKYFLPGLTAKIVGAILIGLIYEYYYGGGDTFNFFLHSRIINNSLDISTGTWFRLITHTADERNVNDLFAMSEMYWYDDKASYTTSAIGAFIGMFCFTRYLPINVILGAISFSGVWLLFITYAQQYRALIKPVAIAMLFLPGVVIWGSGLFKDTLCMTAIGWLTYSFFTFFEKKNYRFGLVLLMIISSLLLFVVKSYILISFLPLLVLKTALAIRKQVQKGVKRTILTISFIPVIAIIGFFAYRKANDEMASFSIDKIVQTVVTQKNYLLRVSLEQEGSAYDLGEFDPTLRGMLSKALPAINVTLFRPYIWEARSPFLLIVAFESLLFLLATLLLVLTRNPIKTIVKILKDPNLVLCLVFSLVFAFFAGISSFNFGTLSRYKIPCLPFYGLFLIILLYRPKKAPILKAHDHGGKDPEFPLSEI